jgi:type II secretory pathway component PulF
MRYKFTARDASGRPVKGTVEAVTPEAAAKQIAEQKLVPVGIYKINEGFSLSSLNALTGRVTSREVTNFTRQMSTMITAGLPLTDALNLLKTQSQPTFSKIIGTLLDDVQGGLSLSTAMAKFPNVFSKVYVALIKAGEQAGVMETILNRLADTTEKSQEFKGKVTGAMIYPIIILVGMVAVMVLMMVVVIPKLTALYADFGAELPLATRIMMSMSDFTVHYWWAIVIIGGGLFWTLGQFMRTPSGRMSVDKLVYQLPVMGLLVKQVMMTEFTRTLGLLVSSGVSVVEGLKIVEDTSNNSVARSDIRRIGHQVEKGFPLSVCFTESDTFPPIVGQMVAVGEETGKLDEVLTKLSHYFETESDEKVKGLTTAIEPLILIVLAIGVGFLMYAVIMPIYSITNKF